MELPGKITNTVNTIRQLLNPFTVFCTEPEVSFNLKGVPRMEQIIDGFDPGPKSPEVFPFEDQVLYLLQWPGF